MSAPEGFAWTERGPGEVVISKHGHPVTTLRGSQAARFLVEVDESDAQLVMARFTGNFKRGNERQARRHPRNRGGAAR